MKMNHVIICAFLFLVISNQVSGQSALLDAYIMEGLKSNLALKQKESSYEKSLYVLKEAKSWFYPQVSLNARYTVADGGRLIEFPIGDLLNPVYSTLNTLTGTNNFQQVENQSFRFLRPQEQETKIQIIQPLLNTDIYFNNKIKSAMLNAERVDVEIYKRHLVAEIKTAYFNYLKTIQLTELLREFHFLAEENLRVNEKLFANDMVTRDRIFRSQAELGKLEQQIAVAEKDRQVAGAFFNFLLNRDLQTEILADESFFDVSVSQPDLKFFDEQALTSREELTRLGILEDISASFVKMNRMKSLPELLIAMDYGFQGTRYRFTGEDDFVMASVVLRWNIFHGLQNRHKIRQSQVDELIVSTRKQEATELIRLEVTQTWYQLKAAEKALSAANVEHTAARLAFQIVEKQYNNGMISLLEYLDARTALLAAATNEITSRYEYHIKITDYERVACLYPIDNE